MSTAPHSARAVEDLSPEPSPPPVAGIAETVGEVLAQAAASSQASGPDDFVEIRAITEAMVRLLIGIPMRSDGQLTVKSLATEAGLK